MLPVFFKLEGRKVLLAGGTDAAAWKAELLAAAGAKVHVFAPELSPEFVRIIGARPEAYMHYTKPWDVDAFQGAEIAIADVENEGEARAFACAGRAAGVPTNVIDKPEFCQFQFGSIVNRSPVIVSISTNGAAPILGQAIRRRIEALLPPSIAGWGALAQSIRAHVSQRLKTAAQRRVLWERFVDRAFTSSNPSADGLFEPAAAGGRVTLVGAGPGDAELLTIKAIRALQSADVILFDDLVSDDVLGLARREATRMLVGKRSGQVSCKQNDINEMMLKLAKAGKDVVRLMFGDPAIFGRAGEEIICLKQHNIPVSIVPGITSASAMTAQAEVFPPHRDHAQSDRFDTSHTRYGN